MTEREDTIERIERVLELTHKKSITVTIPRLTAERAVAMLKEQEAVEPIEEFRKGANCHVYHCKRCGNIVGTILGGKRPIAKLSIEHFCDVCGQSVKWAGYQAEGGEVK